MTTERYLRLIAGSFVLVSVVLGYFHSPYWFLFTGFVALLLIIVALGWAWTTRHQPAPLRTASHVVLTIAALAGVLALAKIWRRDAPAGRP